MTINIVFFRAAFILALLSGKIVSLAQELPTDKLQDQFVRYQENALQEKIFVHTSKDNFLAGETLHLKGYSVDAMLHRPLDLSSVMYVQLVNTNDNPVVQIKVAMNSGKGNSSFVIPDTLSTGTYRLIAYTSWMRNFSEDFFFVKRLTILNPLKTLGVRNSSIPDKPIARFFPEGGNLVAGLQSRVAFQVTKNGKGVNAKGAVLSDGDTVARFEAQRFGIGSFVFTPLSGKEYHAVVQTPNGRTQGTLPQVYEKGYVMTTTMGESSVNVTIKTNNTSANDEEVYLLLHNRQKLRRVAKGKLDKVSGAGFSFSLADFDAGITHITLFDAALRPVAERLVFRKPSELLNLSVGNLRGTYTTRQNGKLTLRSAVKGDAISANASMTVYRADQLQGYDSLNFAHYLLLTSELKGEVESPAFYLNGSSQDVVAATDNLMLTHGWTRFKWEDVLKSNWPVIQFNPDNDALTIRAMVTNETGNAAPNVNTFLSVPSNGNQFYAGRSNARGMLQFYTRDLYGKHEVIMQQVGGTSKYNFTLIDPFSKNFPELAVSSPPAFHKDLEELLRTYSIHTQISRAYSRRDTIISRPDTIPFYGIADKSYWLHDYVKFPLVKDVLKEYVFEVIVRRNADRNVMYAFDMVNDKMFEAEPLVLLDGVPVFESDRIVNLPAHHIRKIEVVNRHFYSGVFVFNGIVAFTSHTRNITGVQMNPEALVLDFEGLHRHQEFYLPLYNSGNTNDERVPDLRNVLIWAPDITTDGMGEATVDFSTSDVPGRFIGVIHGLTKNGEPGTATFSFSVQERSSN